MKIHADKLTTGALYDALPAGVIITECEPAKSRTHAHAWIVRLSGSSPYAQQGGTGYKAATWDEHGRWMADLFAIDPGAILGQWKGRTHFYTETRKEHDRMVRYLGMPHTIRKGMTAPWLIGGCEWFALCENEATHHEPHPVLGDVPRCDRCAKVVGA